MASKLKQLLGKLEKQVKRLENMKGGGGGGGGSSGKFIEAYGEFYKKVQQFIGVNKKLGGKYADLGTKVKESFALLKAVLVVASKSKKPAGDKIKDLFTPINKCVKMWDDERFNSKGKPEYDHYSTMMEAMKALQWVAIRDAPFKWVKECNAQSQFWSNKVLQNFRKKDEKHVQWVKLVKEILNDLYEYVKEHHMTGLRWNPKGEDVGDSAPAEDEDCAPPPDMDDLDLNFTPAPVTKGDDGPDLGQVFDDIKKGGFKLKKVTKDMKTKYRKDRTGKVSAAPKKKKPAKKKSTVKVKPPRLDFDGDKKWDVEWQQNNNSIVLDKVKKNHTLYIFRCSNSAIFVKSRMNQICVDKCENVKIIMEGCFAAFEIINSKNIQAQVNNLSPTINVDGVDGIQLFLGEKSFKSEIVVTKTNSFNICPMINDDYDELPVPEQMLVKYDAKKKKLNVEPKHEG